MAAPRPNASSSKTTAAPAKRSVSKVPGSPPAAYTARAKTGMAAKHTADRAISINPIARLDGTLAG